MENYNKNKKGISFFAMIIVVMVLLVAAWALFFTSPTGDIKNDIDFEKTVKSVDEINAKIPSDEFYKKEETKLSLDRAKEDFSKTLGLDTSDMVKRAESDSSNLLGCKVNGVELWYNEKNINANKELSEEKYSDCMPRFKENFDTKFETFLSKRLTDDITDGLSQSGINKNPEVDLKYDNNSKSVDTQITTFYEEESSIAKASLNLQFSSNYYVGSYPDMLKALTGIIPKIPENIKTDVPLCLEDGKDSEINCIKTSIMNLINKENPDIIKSYDFDISFIKDLSDEEYYGLEFVVKDKLTNKNELDFGIILKDNIPYSLITFDLGSYSASDNVLEVSIEEPRFEGKVSSYIILYSYDNFFDSSSSSYDEVLNLLSQNEIPTNFNPTGVMDSDQNKYFYYTLKNGNDISLIVSGNDGFEEDASTKKSTKRVKIFQIYNNKLKGYELLDGSKPVYAYVFATDKNLNYYVKDIEGKTKSFVPISVFGPKPLSVNGKNIVVGNVLGHEKTLSFTIGDYNDSKFDHFDVYAIENGGSLIPFCEAASEQCHYFDGTGKLRQKSGFTFYVSSDTKLEGESNVEFISPSSFLNNLVLDSNKKYDIYVIPVDTQKNGIVRKTPKTWVFEEIKQNVDSWDGVSLSQYFLMKQSQETWLSPAKFSDVVPADNKAPDVYNSIEVNGITKSSDNYLILNWKSKVPNDVVKLSTRVTIKYSNQDDTIYNDYSILENGKVIADSSNILGVTVDNIIPIDSSGNSVPLAQAILGQMHSATYP